MEHKYIFVMSELEKMVEEAWNEGFIEGTLAGRNAYPEDRYNIRASDVRIILEDHAGEEK
jgi:hypothetical protein